MQLIRSPDEGLREPGSADLGRRAVADAADAAATRRCSSTCGRADAYAAGHIPGALHLDLFGVSLIDTDPAPLKAFMWMIEHLFATRGVEASTPVVVYDEQSGIRAARAFWFLEYFGHPSVRRARRRLRRVDPRRVSGHPRRARRPPTSEWTGDARGRRDRDLARRAARHRPAGRGDPRHAHRRRVLRHDRPRRARRRRSPAPSTSSGRATSAPTARSSPPPS